MRSSLEDKPLPKAAGGKLRRSNMRRSCSTRHLRALHILPLVGAIAFATSLAAQETEELVVQVTGELVTPKQYTLTLETGSIADRAVRVYSEPSHTFLVLLVDSKFEATVEFSSWKDSLASSMEPLATVVTSLPLGKPRVTIPARPDSDDAMAVWVYGTWPDGAIEDRQVSEVRIEGQDFEISTYVPTGDFAKGGGPGGKL